MTFAIGTPHRKGCGNLDARTGGHDSRHVEADIKTCPHCQAVINLQRWKEEGGWCSKCQAPLCSNPDCIKRTAELGCVPFTQALEREWALKGKLDHFRKLAGLDPEQPKTAQVFIAAR